MPYRPSPEHQQRINERREAKATRRLNQQLETERLRGVMEMLARMPHADTKESQVFSRLLRTALEVPRNHGDYQKWRKVELPTESESPFAEGDS